MGRAKNIMESVEDSEVYQKIYKYIHIKNVL